MKANRYLSVADVLLLHVTVMEGFGFRAEPLRDQGLLESALQKPRKAAHYEGADLVRQAALLAVGVAQNQPFVDGNKRTAQIVCYAFVRANGAAFTGEPLALARQLELLVERTDSLDAATDRFEHWLRGHVAG